MAFSPGMLCSSGIQVQIIYTILADERDSRGGIRMHARTTSHPLRSEASREAPTSSMLFWRRERSNIFRLSDRNNFKKKLASGRVTVGNIAEGSPRHNTPLYHAA